MFWDNLNSIASDNEENLAVQSLFGVGTIHTSNWDSSPILFKSSPHKIEKIVTIKVNPLHKAIQFWLSALNDCHLPTLLIDPSLHLNFGIKFINLLSEVVPKISPLGLQGGCQETVLNRKHLRM